MQISHQTHSMQNLEYANSPEKRNIEAIIITKSVTQLN